jgi:hypothetical protein
MGLFSQDNNQPPPPPPPPPLPPAANPPSYASGSVQSAAQEARRRASVAAGIGAAGFAGTDLTKAADGATDRDKIPLAKAGLSGGAAV